MVSVTAASGVLLCHPAWLGLSTAQKTKQAGQGDENVGEEHIQFPAPGPLTSPVGESWPF